MKFEETALPGVRRITLDSFSDFRGSYTETYNERLYIENGVQIPFVADDISVSSKHVLRGIHGDHKTWKLVTCLSGSFYLVVVNCDETSPHFAKWESFALSRENRTQILIPPKHGNAHLVLSDEAIFHYKQSEYYVSESKFIYRYDDPRFDIWWPIKNPIISRRDDVGKYL